MPAKMRSPRRHNGVFLFEPSFASFVSFADLVPIVVAADEQLERRLS
jgi:hypothetical protein